MASTSKNEPKLTEIDDNDRYTLFDVEYPNGDKGQAILCKSCSRISWNENGPNTVSAHARATTKDVRIASLPLDHPCHQISAIQH